MNSRMVLSLVTVLGLTSLGHAGAPEVPSSDVPDLPAQGNQFTIREEPSLAAAATPEPAGLVLLGTGALASAVYIVRHRKRRRN